jgi:hypothetical protein
MPRWGSHAASHSDWPVNVSLTCHSSDRKLKLGVSYVSPSTCRDRMGRWFYRRYSTVQSFLGSEHRACGPSSAQCVSRAAAGLQAQTNCPCTSILITKGSTSYCTVYVATGVARWVCICIHGRIRIGSRIKSNKQCICTGKTANKK